jgi:hypothetical protein
MRQVNERRTRGQGTLLGVRAAVMRRNTSIDPSALDCTVAIE